MNYHQRPPKLRYHLSGIGTNCGWTAAPVINDDVIAICGCGSVQNERIGLLRKEIRPIPILQAIDARTGHVNFQIERSGPEHMEIETSNPCFTPSGEIIMAVYEHNIAVSLLRISPDGEVISDQVLETTYPFIASDGSSKLMLELKSVAADRYILSWMYRQVREFGIHLRNTGDSAPTWKTSERMIGSHGSTVIGIETPKDGGNVIARRLEDGEKIWSLQIGDAIVATVGIGLVVIVDRSRQFIEQKSARRQIEDEVVVGSESGALSDSDLDTAIDRASQIIPNAPATIRVHDVENGRELWSVEIPGDVLDVKLAEDSLVVLSSTSDGDGMLRIFQPDGKLFYKRDIAGRRIDRWPKENDTFRIIGLTTDFMIWADSDTLFCHRHQSSTDAWQMALPDPCIGFRPSILERSLPQASIAMSDRLLVLRDGPDLWIYEI